MNEKNNLRERFYEEEFRYDSLIYFIVFLSAVIVLGASIFLYLDKEVEVRQIDSSFNVVDRIGYNPDIYGANFGKVLPGNKVEKVINVKNNYNFSVKVYSYAGGDLEGLVYGDTGKVLLPNSGDDFNFTLIVPENYPYGEYTGQIYLKFKKV